LGILSGLLSGFVFIVILIIIILILITLEDPEWWISLKGMSVKKQILNIFFLIIIWIVIQLLFGRIK
jgi:hypothetical protein